MPPVAFRNPWQRTAQPLQTVAVIPARMQSTRLPDKPLADIAGRPMIEHVYRAAAASPSVDAVVVATDDARVVEAVERFGGIARMTDPAHRTGTDRIAEIAATLPCEIVVNVQGDEPLIDSETIEAAVAPLLADPSLEMSTACRALTDDVEIRDPHVVKVVRDRRGDALYFSRTPIPFQRGPRATVWKHVGIYGYRRTFLLAFARLEPTPLEQAESLEQLRALEHGFRIHVAETTHDSIGVDTPEDLDRVRRRLAVDVREPVTAAAGDTTHT